MEFNDKQRLFLERLVEISSEEDIDRLEPKNIVYAKNSPFRVFEKREGDMLSFYYHYGVPGEGIHLVKLPRMYVSHTGKSVCFSPFGCTGTLDSLTPEDGEEYTKRRDDLISVGLMPEP